jgi:23S rRNA pseudouridine1911/1915/1917 synthase
VNDVRLVDTVGSGRLDRFVADRLDDVSRSEVQRWIEAGQVTVNGRTAKASRRLEAGDVVCVTLPEAVPATLQPWETPLSIVYEDADCVVIDKPAGMVVHPATSHQQDTLVNALLARYPEIAAMADPNTEEGIRPGIVHRLDKDTSGLIVVARHEAARLALQRQFKARSVEKIYLALLYGRLSPPEGRIAVPIGRDPRHRQRIAVFPDGREAITAYATRQFLFMPHGAREFYTLTEAHLLTGRTHQIRVHFAHLGHSIVGDVVYGRRKRRLACPRQFLHAYRLGIRLPGDGRWVEFVSALPADLQQVLSQLAAVT